MVLVRICSLEDSLFVNCLFVNCCKLTKSKIKDWIVLGAVGGPSDIGDPRFECCHRQIKTSGQECLIRIKRLFFPLDECGVDRTTCRRTTLLTSYDAAIYKVLYLSLPIYLARPFQMSGLQRGCERWCESNDKLCDNYNVDWCDQSRTIAWWY